MDSGIRKTPALLHKWWMTFARTLGWLNTRILLTLVYLIVIGIPAIIMKITRRDPLKRRFTSAASYWQKKDHTNHTLDEARRQF